MSNASCWHQWHISGMWSCWLKVNPKFWRKFYIRSFHHLGPGVVCHGCLPGVFMWLLSPDSMLDKIVIYIPMRHFVCVCILPLVLSHTKDLSWGVVIAGRCFCHTSVQCPLSGCLTSTSKDAPCCSLDITGMGKEGEDLVILKIKLVEALRMASTEEYNTSGVSLIFQRCF